MEQSLSIDEIKGMLNEKGKSLFISTLLYYYDEYYKDIWSDIFGELYIGKNPTILKSSYQILYFEFSGIVTDSIDSTYLGFKTNIKNALIEFLVKYSYPKTDIDELISSDAPEVYSVPICKDQF